MKKLKVKEMKSTLGGATPFDLDDCIYDYRGCFHDKCLVILDCGDYKFKSYMTKSEYWDF